MVDGPLPADEVRAAIRTKLEQSVGPVFFSDLRAHVDRDALFVVAKTVALVECAVAVATDDVATVGRWIESGELRKPSRAEREMWPPETERRWNALVVQPFVLVQEIAGPVESA